MKKFFKIVGIALGVIVLILALLVGYSAITPLKTYEAKSLQVQIPSDSLSLAKGERIVRTVCAYCHLGDDGKLSGRLFSRAEDDFGESWTANITRSKEHGIGEYTDGELSYLLRTGINRKGRNVGPMMSHPNMSDEDQAAIIAFLRSDADITMPSEIVHPLPAYIESALVKTMVRLGLFVPLKFDEKPRPAVDKSDKINYGKYLLQEVYDCGPCHSQSFETYNGYEPEKSPSYLSGGNMIVDHSFNEVISANITSSKEFGIGNYTEEQFIKMVKNGEKADGSIAKPNMPRMPLVTDEELSAIWAYLQTVPAVDKKPVAN